MYMRAMSATITTAATATTETVDAAIIPRVSLLRSAFET
jgi:hypothetical protein